MDERRAYRVLERTVEIHPPIDPGQLESISRLLGRALAYRGGTPNYVVDLTEAAAADDLLGYLRAQRLAHTVAEERRYEPP